MRCFTTSNLHFLPQFVWNVVLLVYCNWCNLICSIFPLLLYTEWESFWMMKFFRFAFMLLGRLSHKINWQQPTNRNFFAKLSSSSSPVKLSTALILIISTSTHPPIGYFRLFWILDLFEKCWPPPFGSILDFFEFQTLFYIAPRVPYGPQICNLDFLKNSDPKVQNFPVF